MNEAMKYTKGGDSVTITFGGKIINKMDILLC